MTIATIEDAPLQADLYEWPETFGPVPDEMLRPAPWSFYRETRRKARLKRLCDCGHWIDGTEPYRYQVGKVPGERWLFQRTDCEFCARADARY